MPHRNGKEKEIGIVYLHCFYGDVHDPGSMGEDSLTRFITVYVLYQLVRSRFFFRWQKKPSSIVMHLTSDLYLDITCRYFSSIKYLINRDKLPLTILCNSELGRDALNNFNDWI